MSWRSSATWSSSSCCCSEAAALESSWSWSSSSSDEEENVAAEDSTTAAAKNDSGSTSLVFLLALPKSREEIDPGSYLRLCDWSSIFARKVSGGGERCEKELKELLRAAWCGGVAELGIVYKWLWSILLVQEGEKNLVTRSLPGSIRPIKTPV